MADPTWLSAPRDFSNSSALRSISSTSATVKNMASVIAADEASRGLGSSTRVFRWPDSSAAWRS
jgi:hypothetical protein